MEQLKPCPFCGGTDVKFDHMHDDKGVAIGGAIVCYDCLIVFIRLGAVCEDDVIKAWNRRADNGTD